MYAAVRAGQQGILVSNDEMRDHIFQVRLLMSCRHFTASDVEGSSIWQRMRTILQRRSTARSLYVTPGLGG
jgi:hypothetical protein